MKCFRLRCYVNNSFLVFHQGTKHSKTKKHSRFALVFHTVFSCLDPLMKHSNSLFTYNLTTNNCIHSYNTRSCNNLHLPKANTNWGKLRPTYYASMDFNNLTSSVTNVSSLSQFKTQLNLLRT